MTSRSRQGLALTTVIARERRATSRVVLERKQYSNDVAVVVGKVHVHANGIGDVDAEDVFDRIREGSGALIFAARGEGVSRRSRCR